MDTVRENQSLIVRVVSVVLAFVLGLLMLRASKSQGAAGRGSGPAALTEGASAPALNADAGASRMVPELAGRQVNTDARHRVGLTVNQQPDVAAKLVRAWMRET
jgi:flagellar biosynthesis/type III secretory pathway M-ring protein FliF/YscJ